MSKQSLAEAFLEHAQAAALLGRAASDWLEPALGEHVAAGRQAWPDLFLEPTWFVRHLAEHATARNDVRAALDAMPSADVYLACACAAGDGRAIEMLEREYFGEIVAVLKASYPPAFVDEAQQRLRVKLFVAEKGARPQIADYSGRGPLRNWLSVVAMRTAIDLAREGQRQVPFDSRADLAPAQGLHPELALVRQRYRDQFQSFFEESLGILSRRQRTLFRLYLLDGLSMEEIGRLQGVSHSSISRQIAAARESVLTELRRLLVERLHADPQEIDSLIRALQSNLDVSVEAFLGSVA